MASFSNCLFIDDKMLKGSDRGVREVVIWKGLGNTTDYTTILQMQHSIMIVRVGQCQDKLFQMTAIAHVRVERSFLCFSNQIRLRGQAIMQISPVLPQEHQMMNARMCELLMDNLDLREV